MRVRRSRLTGEQTRRLLEHFVAGTPARTAAELAQVNRNTARLFYHKVREIIAQRLDGESPLAGEIEVEVDDAGVHQALDVSDLHHQPVPRRARVATDCDYITTENFRNQAKRHLRRYNGVPRQHLHLFLKECEWRINYGPPKELLRILKFWIRRDSRTSSSMPGR